MQLRNHAETLFDNTPLFLQYYYFSYQHFL